MSILDYFFDPYNWSVLGLVLVTLSIFGHFLLPKTTVTQKGLFVASVFLMYLVLGSPIGNLNDYGLHSINMLKHIVLLMITPILILKSVPSTIFNSSFFNSISLFREPQKYFLITWIIGAAAMWMGHFLSAAIMSSNLGISVCGISVSKDSWVSHMPEVVVYGMLFLAGLLLALPVFHPNNSKRLHPVKSVAYLFTACVSCSAMGLYVTFMATSASAVDVAPVLTTLRNPLPMSVRTDQELAGLLMWVPGCILYVTSAAELLLTWYDGAPTVTEEQLADLPISKK